MIAKSNIKVCFSTRINREDCLEWDSFWEVTNEDCFGGNNASYHVSIVNPMPLCEFENIAKEIKEVVAYRNNSSVDYSNNDITFNQGGMISEIKYYFHRK